MYVGYIFLLEDDYDGIACSSIAYATNNFFHSGIVYN
jgi:hypothetical protein